jgi:hypothetical protein
VHAWAKQHHDRSLPMFSANAGCAACAWLLDGSATIGSRFPIASTRMPSASVSQIPAAHLLTVFTVAGATITASGSGSTSGSPGFLYSLRTGCPVCRSSAAVSVNRRPDGVVSTHTSQPRRWARLTSWPTSAAGGAAQATT